MLNKERSMNKIVLTKDNLLSPAQFKMMLDQMTVRNLLFDDILASLRELVAYENKYKMDSDVFYARFMRGELGDDLPFIMWAGHYEAYLEAKQEIADDLAEIALTA